jgi:hypothetical protein
VWHGCRVDAAVTPETHPEHTPQCVCSTSRCFWAGLGPVPLLGPGPKRLAAGLPRETPGVSRGVIPSRVGLPLRMGLCGVVEPQLGVLCLTATPSCQGVHVLVSCGHVSQRGAYITSGGPVVSANPMHAAVGNAGARDTPYPSWLQRVPYPGGPYTILPVSHRSSVVAVPSSP